MSSTYLVSGHISTRVYYQCGNTSHATREADNVGYEFFPPAQHRVQADSAESAAAAFIREQLTDPGVAFGHEAIGSLTATGDVDYHGEEEGYSLNFEASLAPREHTHIFMPCCGEAPTRVWGELSLDVACRP